MAAPKSKLAELHEMLAEVMLEDLRQSIADKIPLPAANLGVIRQFLKDNEITASVDADDMKQLRDEFKADLESKREQRKRVTHALSEDVMSHILQ